MSIERIDIAKFRGFHQVGFELGENLTVIAGQNGTQKTTLLGMLTQPFAITDKKNPLSNEKPLCGGNYKSSFPEKFKLSEKFDKPKEHEWTLTYDGGKTFTVESIKSNDDRKNHIRFWKKEKSSRKKGSGYIPKPVIYLSLSRLLPIGEDEAISDSSNSVKLTESEEKLYQKLHNKILIIPDVPITKISHLESQNKNTLSANTDFYDWKMNSAGQDDIGKIILALISFKRLKEKYGTAYTGGILAVDELDATLYPASQEKLIEVLRTYASKYDIQIFFTTHSLSMLKHICSTIEENKVAKDIKLVYLEKINQTIKCIENISYENIMDKLFAMSTKKTESRIMTFSEDGEGRCWLKVLLGHTRTKTLKIVDCNIGCASLIQLTKQKIPPFVFPNSIIILDGDARHDVEKLSKTLKNYLVLPGDISPERLLAKYLKDLPDDNPFWEKCGNNYTKQVAFRDYQYDEIMENREKAKEWFNSQLHHWGRNATRAITAWCEANPGAKEDFIVKFDELLKKWGK